MKVIKNGESWEMVEGQTKLSTDKVSLIKEMFSQGYEEEEIFLGFSEIENGKTVVHYGINKTFIFAE